MRQNELPPVPGSIHKKKRLGRGNASGHGTYSGRGIKGQKSRSGPDLRIGFEGGQIPLVRGLSRKRGFNNRFRIEYEPINVGQLNKLPAGSDVTPESLREAGIVKSRLLPVKVLGDGELTIKLKVDVDKVSAGARAKIEAAGGTAVQRVPGRVPIEVETEPAEPAAAPQEKTPAAEPEAAAPRARRGRARAASEGSSEEPSEGEETAEAE